MRVPISERGKDARARIVESASDLFYRRGVSATGLSEVAEASGTGKGQMYHYFDSKEDLVRAVLAAQIAHTIDPQVERLTSMTNADDLRAWASEAIGNHRDSQTIRCPLGSLVVEISASYPKLKTDLRDGFQRWQELLQAALSRLQLSRQVRHDRTAAELAQLLLSAYEGGVTMSEVNESTRPLEIALNAAVDYMLQKP